MVNGYLITWATHDGTYTSHEFVIEKIDGVFPVKSNAKVSKTDFTILNSSDFMEVDSFEELRVFNSYLALVQGYSNVVSIEILNVLPDKGIDFFEKSTLKLLVYHLFTEECNRVSKMEYMVGNVSN